MKYLPPDHPFIEAIRNADLAAVKELIAQDSSLVDAQVLGDIYLTGKVWKDGKHVEIDETDSHQAGPLHFAAFHSRTELAQLLIDMGADLSLGADFGEERDSTPVGIAAWNGNAATLKVLLKAANNAGLKMDLNPGLHSALSHGAWDKAELLLEHGANHDICTAAQAGNLDKLKRLIVESPNSVDQDNWNYGRTPLEQALTVGQVKSAEMLEAHGAKVSIQAATAMGRLDEIKKLLENDSEAATRKFDKFPLLCWAIMGGQVNAVKLLLEKGADPDGDDEWGVSPLRYSTQVKGEDGAAIVDLLVAAGADLNRKSRGYTALECCKGNQHVEQRLIHHMENNGTD